MTWTTVSAALEFNPSNWTSRSGWTEQALSGSEQTQIINALSGLYSSFATAQSMLDDLARFSSMIRESCRSGDGLVQRSGWWRSIFCLGDISGPDAYYISDHGKWILRHPIWNYI